MHSVCQYILKEKPCAFEARRGMRLYLVHFNQHECGKDVSPILRQYYTFGTMNEKESLEKWQFYS